jgi:hypothetical protein
MPRNKNAHKHINRSSYSKNSDLQARRAEAFNHTPNVKAADSAFVVEGRKLRVI